MSFVHQLIAVIFAIGVIFCLLITILLSLYKKREVAKKLGSGQGQDESQAAPPAGPSSTPATASTPAPATIPTSLRVRLALMSLGILATSLTMWFVVMPYIREPKPSPSPASVAKKTPQVTNIPLKFVGGDGSYEKHGLVGVQNGGHAFFATHSLPWRKKATFHVVVEVLRQTTGNVCLEINGGRGGQKFYNHPASSTFSIDVFFESGERGDSAFFNPGPNQIKIWSPGADIVIRCVSVDMIYQE
jgi:hypothetical protein